MREFWGGRGGFRHDETDDAFGEGWGRVVDLQLLLLIDRYIQFNWSTGQYSYSTVHACWRAICTVHTSRHDIERDVDYAFRLP